MVTNPGIVKEVLIAAGNPVEAARIKAEYGLTDMEFSILLELASGRVTEAAEGLDAYTRRISVLEAKLFTYERFIFVMAIVILLLMYVGVYMVSRFCF